MKNFSAKSFLHHSILEKNEILHLLHGNVAMLMRKHSEWGTRNHHQRIFRKVWIMYIESVDQKMNFLYDTDEIEIGPFYRSFSNFWSIFGGICIQV